MFHDTHPLCKLFTRYDDQLITDDLIGHWVGTDFSEPGTTWENRITDGKHLYLINGITHTPPAGPNEAGFFTSDGVDDYIGAAVGPYAAPAFKINNGASFTICMWVNCNLLPNTSDHHFVTTGIVTYSPIVTNGLQFGTGASGNLAMSYVSKSSFLDGHSFPTSTQLGQQRWYMISVVNNATAVAQDPAGERCYFFKNGLYCPVSDSVSSVGSEMTTRDWENDIEDSLTGTTAVEFGRKHNGSSYEYTASNTHFSDILVYDRALAHSEIISNFNAKKGSFGY
jgi:hypothetical protein